jgi:hypothetical protein
MQMVSCLGMGIFSASQGQSIAGYGFAVFYSIARVSHCVMYILAAYNSKKARVECANEIIFAVISITLLMVGASLADPANWILWILVKEFFYLCFVFVLCLFCVCFVLFCFVYFGLFCFLFCFCFILCCYIHLFIFFF